MVSSPTALSDPSALATSGRPDGDAPAAGGAPSTADDGLHQPAPGARPSPVWPVARRRAMRRALVALARERIHRTGGARLGRTFAWLSTGFFAVTAIVLRISDGELVALSGLLQSAAVWAAWLAGAPIALAAAHDRRARDRSDGIDALAAARGAPRGAVEAARTLAAMMEVAAAVGVPVLALAALDAALSGSFRVLGLRLAAMLAAAVFAATTGVTLGGIAAASGRVGGARGRSLLMAIVIAPWLVADFFGHASWSIPGALGALLSFGIDLASGGGAA